MGDEVDYPLPFALRDGSGILSRYNQKILKQLQQAPQLLDGILRGVERESLRVTPTGHLAQTPHPQGLGSALTHSLITTDYSEALLEFITPVKRSVDEMLTLLSDIHKQAYSKIGDELLWPLSMPCYINDDAAIPIAQYGDSNIGRMKTLYRKGLHHRYGSAMQVIAGVHFNFSFPDSVWELWDASLSPDPNHLNSIRSNGYLGLIRNMRRLVWMLAYLFGASPALCRSFVERKGSELPFKTLGRGTLYLPHATSLRMSDLGYTNRVQSKLAVDYNSLPGYIASVRRALNTPVPMFEALGVKQQGEWKQLNANLLQIENELYAPVRPKRVAFSGESPSQALQRGGIEYIEVRALDNDPFSDLGISAEQVRFLDLFLLHCLLREDDLLDQEGIQRAHHNLTATVLYGRDPAVELERKKGRVKLRDWLREELESMAPLVELMDQRDGGDAYASALAVQLGKCDDADQTPSARLLELLNQQCCDNADIAMTLAAQHKASVMARPYAQCDEAGFAEEAARSLAQQRAIEAADTLDFDTFLSQQQQ